MPSHNVDDILFAKSNPAVAASIDLTSSEDPSPQDIKNPAIHSEEPEEKKTFLDQFREDKKAALENLEENSAENLQIGDESTSKSENRDDSVGDAKGESKADAAQLDEYGNELPKERVYSEKEVQRMIQDRLSRGRHVEPQPQYSPQQVQQAQQQGFEPNPNSEQSWEQQLEAFNDNWYDKKQREEGQKQWQAQEQRRQAEFESKFATGVHKYEDFEQVTSDKPITNSIMMAARGLNDPAAFIYTASKNHAGELARIAQIGDPIQVAAEVGKLEERMRKARTISQAPRPLSKTKGDMGTHKPEPTKPTIDQLIMQDAKRKLSRR